MGKLTEHYIGRKKIHLMIGEGLVLVKPTVVTTVLGSCVSVTMHCPEKKIGAIFHAVMPVMPEEERASFVQSHYKYVDSSIRQIIRLLKRKGVDLKKVEAKVFGGAQAISTDQSKPGATNIRVAFEMLSQHNIKILASDVGGRNGRNLIFITDKGEVYIKTHKNNPFKDLGK